MTHQPFGKVPAAVPAFAEVKDRGAIDAGLLGAPTASATALDQSFVRGIAWTGAVKWVVQLLTWGTTIFVAHILSPEDFGLLSMGTVLLTFITLLGESGIGVAVVTTREITREQVAQLNGGAVILGLASLAVAGLCAIPAARFYNTPALAPVIGSMSLVLVVVAFRIVPGALMQRDRQFARLAAIDGGQGVLQAGATLVLAMLGFRYWSLVLAALIGAFAGTLATVVARPYPLRLPRWDTLRPLLPFTREILLARVFWYAYSNSDFIVAGKRLGSQALGAYSYAWTLASMPVDKITALVGSVTPSMFAAVQHDTAALRRYFLIVTEGLATIAFPLTIGIALVAPDFVPVVFGDRWIFMTVPLQVLATYASVRTISPPASLVLVVTGDTRYLMYWNAAAAVFLPLAFFVGSKWGIAGIAIAWTIAHPLVVFLPINARVFQRLGLSIPLYLRSLWPAISGCLLMVAAVAFSRAALPSSVAQGARLAAQVVAGGLVYSASILLFHRDRVSAFLVVWRRRAA